MNPIRRAGTAVVNTSLADVGTTLWKGLKILSRVRIILLPENNRMLAGPTSETDTTSKDHVESRVN